LQCVMKARAQMATVPRRRRLPIPARPTGQESGPCQLNYQASVSGRSNHSLSEPSPLRQRVRRFNRRRFVAPKEEPFEFTSLRYCLAAVKNPGFYQSHETSHHFRKRARANSLLKRASRARRTNLSYRGTSLRRTPPPLGPYCRPRACYPPWISKNPHGCTSHGVWSRLVERTYLGTGVPHL
jgi:hypothetical protein